MSTPSLKSPYNSHIEKQDFFAVVQHYEKAFLNACRASGLDANRLGEDGSPSNEAIRFTSKNSLAFSLDDLKLISGGSEQPQQYEYIVSFMGLIGAAGVLPQQYTKLSLERLKQGDSALSDFINIFEHRLISLFYKSLGKYKLSAQYREEKGQAVDNFSRVLQSLVSYRYQHTFQLYYSGHFSKANRSITNLQSMLKDIVKGDIFVKSFVGQWLPIKNSDRCKIGARGHNNHLPSGLMLGKRFWDKQSCIRIIFKKLTLNEFQKLQKGKEKYLRLNALVRAYLPAHIDVYIECHVSTDKHQLQTLGKGCQLGNTWLMNKPADVLIAKYKLKNN